MKKLLVSIMISLFALSFAACGEAAATSTTPETTEEVENDTIEYMDFEGEGAGQGVEKSDEELAALVTEAAEYSSGDDYDTHVIESKEENKDSKWKANCPYVPASEFWVSDTEFDLIGWFEANGTQTIWFYSVSGAKVDKADCDNAYICRGLLSFDGETSWSITNSVMVFKGVGTGNELCHYECKNHENIVDITGYSNLSISSEAIREIDFAIKSIKENPYSDDPLNHAEGWDY